jgi:hypothetical protein
MRTCIGISVVIHAVVMLWLVLAPGVRTLGPANAEAIMVDLVPPQEAPAAAPTQPQSQDAKSEQAKSEQAKSAEPKPELPRTATRKPEPARPEPTRPDPIKPDPTKPPPSSAEEQAATAARLAWLLNLPTGTEASLGGPPSDSKSNLSSDEIANFKTQVSKCWVVPAGVPNAPGFDVLIRIALRPDGTLGAKPELVRAPASDAGPPLVDTAKRALQKCQPYATLPADRYQDWKILELTFTAQGPAGLSGPVRQ